MSWNTTLWPATVARLEPEFLDLLGYYTGNTEYQIPHGRGASAVPPARLSTAQSQEFVLGTRDTKKPGHSSSA
jgi:hypothetical protein